MKNIGRTLCKVILVFSLAGLLSASGQGFVNFDFENANLAGYGAGSVPSSSAIPGWTAYIGGTQLTNINYDIGSSGGIEVSLIISTNLQGDYYLLLQGSVSVSPSVNEPAAIGQTGTVPAGAQSLIWWGAGPDSVSFNGQMLSFSRIGSGSHYSIYAANISAFDGETGQLLFSSFRYPAVPSSIIDNIQFSSSPVPEPSVVSLFTLTGFSVYLLRRKTRDL